jgi:hypothetical protein
MRGTIRPLPNTPSWRRYSFKNTGTTSPLPQIKDKMGGACRSFGRDENCIRNFGGKTLREKTTWKT